MTLPWMTRSCMAAALATGSAARIESMCSTATTSGYLLCWCCRLPFATFHGEKHGQKSEFSTKMQVFLEKDGGWDDQQASSRTVDWPINWYTSWWSGVCKSPFHGIILQWCYSFALRLTFVSRGKEMSLSRSLGSYYKLPKSDPYAVY